MGEEQAFSTEEDIFDALDRLNIITYGWFEHGDMAGIHFEGFPDPQGELDNFTIQGGKHRAGAFKFLKQESLAAKQAGAQFFVESDAHGDRLVRHQQGIFLGNDRLPAIQIDGDDLTRELAGKGNLSLRLAGAVTHHKDRLAGECPPERAHQPAAAHIGFHLHFTVHPAQGAWFGEHFGVGGKGERYNLHHRAKHFVSRASQRFPT